MNSQKPKIMKLIKHFLKKFSRKERIMNRFKNFSIDDKVKVLSAPKHGDGTDGFVGLEGTIENMTDGTFYLPNPYSLRTKDYGSITLVSESLVLVMTGLSNVKLEKIQS